MKITRVMVATYIQYAVTHSTLKFTVGESLPADQSKVQSESKSLQEAIIKLITNLIWLMKEVVANKDQ